MQQVGCATDDPSPSSSEKLSAPLISDLRLSIFPSIPVKVMVGLNTSLINGKPLAAVNSMAIVQRVVTDVASLAQISCSSNLGLKALHEEGIIGMRDHRPNDDY